MSENGSLSNCLMDSDRDVRKRARWLRANALLMSVILEAALIAALLLFPLIAPSTIHGQVTWTPPVPYGGHAVPQHPHLDPGARPPHGKAYSPYTEPPTIPNHVAPPSNEPPVDYVPDDRQTIGVGPDGSGIGIPGGSETGPIITIAAPVVKPPVKPVNVSEGVMEAMLIHRVQPTYPIIAKLNHISGTVVLHAVIGTDGTIQELEVESGNGILAVAAFTAVREWRYRPTLLSGRPVEVETYITVKFVLDQS